MIVQQILKTTNDKMSIEITMDDERVFRVRDGEPEYNTPERNFNNCYNIIELMKRCYEIGKSGEECTFEIKDVL